MVFCHNILESTNNNVSILTANDLPKYKINKIIMLQNTTVNSASTISSNIQKQNSYFENSNQSASIASANSNSLISNQGANQASSTATSAKLQPVLTEPTKPESQLINQKQTFKRKVHENEKVTRNYF